MSRDKVHFKGKGKGKMLSMYQSRHVSKFINKYPKEIKTRGPRAQIINKNYLKTFLQNNLSHYEDLGIEISSGVEDYFNVLFEKFIIEKITRATKHIQEDNTKFQSEKKIRIDYRTLNMLDYKENKKNYAVICYDKTNIIHT